MNVEGDFEMLKTILKYQILVYILAIGATVYFLVSAENKVEVIIFSLLCLLVALFGVTRKSKNK